MTDRELLELAAMAAWYKRTRESANGMFQVHGWHEDYESDWEYWNPLTDDGDALRLAVKLEMQVEYLDMTGNARARSRWMGNTQEWQTNYCCEDHLREKDPYAATRRAIVRAAAEIGKGMK